MQVRNKDTGKIEHLRHGPATDAVSAGTHEFVNDDSVDDPQGAKSDEAKSTKRTNLAK